MALLLTSLLLILTCALSWCFAGTSTFRVNLTPTPSALRKRNLLRCFAAAIALALVIWAIPGSPDLGPGELLIVSSSTTLAILPLFLLWLALSGSISFVLSCVLWGEIIRPHKPAYDTPLPDQMLMAAASQKVEAMALKNPRIEAYWFLGIGLVSLFAVLAMEHRTMTLTEAGLTQAGFLGTMESVPWDQVDSFAWDGPNSTNHVTATWRLRDQAAIVIGSDSYWSLGATTRESLDAIHVDRGVRVANAAKP